HSPWKRHRPHDQNANVSESHQLHHRYESLWKQVIDPKYHAHAYNNVGKTFHPVYHPIPYRSKSIYFHLQSTTIGRPRYKDYFHLQDWYVAKAIWEPHQTSLRHPT